MLSSYMQFYHHKILVVSVLGSVLADTLGKGCVLLVKGSEQSLGYAP